MIKQENICIPVFVEITTNISDKHNFVFIKHFILINRDAHPECPETDRGIKGDQVNKED